MEPDRQTYFVYYVSRKYYDSDNYPCWDQWSDELYEDKAEVQALVDKENERASEYVRAKYDRDVKQWLRDKLEFEALVTAGLREPNSPGPHHAEPTFRYNPEYELGEYEVYRAAR